MNLECSQDFPNSSFWPKLETMDILAFFLTFSPAIFKWQTTEFQQCERFEAQGM